jgi:hypothetical protein
MPFMRSYNRANDVGRMKTRHPGRHGGTPLHYKKWEVCAVCHKLAKVSAYICDECNKKEWKKIYNDIPEVKAKKREYYMKNREKQREYYRLYNLKKKNKLAFVPQEASVGIGLEGSLNSIDTQ